MKLNELISAFKVAVREVIKEELTEILKEGLQSTINEMAQPKKSVKNETVRVAPRMVNEAGKKPKVQFSENKWASILNETPTMQGDSNSRSYADLMNENYETMQFTSKDAVGFGMTRSAKPDILHDPETGKNLQINDHIAAAMTRDYSDLMKAIDRKKGNVK